MPVKVRIREGCEHRTERGLLQAGEVFYASEAELASFGDKFEMVIELGRGSSAGAAAFPPVLAEDVQAAIESAGAIEAARDDEDAGDGDISGADASPQAVELAEAHGVDLALLEGSGQDGRILKKDVAAYLGGSGDA